MGSARKNPLRGTTWVEAVGPWEETVDVDHKSPDGHRKSRKKVAYMEAFKHSAILVTSCSRCVSTARGGFSSQRPMLSLPISAIWPCQAMPIEQNDCDSGRGFIFSVALCSLRLSISLWGTRVIACTRSLRQICTGKVSCGPQSMADLVSLISIEESTGVVEFCCRSPCQSSQKEVRLLDCLLSYLRRLRQVDRVERTRGRDGVRKPLIFTTTSLS